MSENQWAFLTNHAAVLIKLNGEQNLTAREISLELGITVRTVFRIIQDLEEAGYINKSKAGRENRYTINKTLPLRSQQNIQVDDFLQLIST
jgi:uncharacterized membrane protein